MNSIDEGDEPATVVAAATPPPVVAPAVEITDDPGEPDVVDPSAAIEPGTAPDPTAELAKLAGASTPAAKSASKAGASAAGTIADPGSTPPAADPAPPSEVVEPVAAIDPAPAPAEPAKPAAPPPITFADYAGSYRFSGGSAQQAALTQAIEDAVMQLSMAIRGIGRKRLTNTNPIDNKLDIVVTGDKVQTIFESGFDAECTIEGGTVHWTSKKGDKYKVRVRKKDTKIVQVIEGEDGVKTTVFVLSADKQTLTVHHKITADRLDVPMTYKLTYKRK